MKADIELVIEVKEGKRQAFSELVRRHQRPLIRVCMRFTHDLQTAEEVVQDSFIKAFEKIHLFEGRSSFKSWLFQIAINTAKNRLRSMHSEVVSLDYVNVGVAAVAESSLIRRDVQVAVQREVDQLPVKQRTAVILRIYEDMSFKEIAHIMDCPYDTAKANFRHGMLRIRESLETDDALKMLMSTDTDEERTEVEIGAQEVET